MTDPQQEKFEYTAEDMASVRNLGISRGLDMAVEVLTSMEIAAAPPNEKKAFTYAQFAEALAGTINQVAKHLREIAAHYRGEENGQG